MKTDSLAESDRAKIKPRSKVSKRRRARVQKDAENAFLAWMKERAPDQSPEVSRRGWPDFWVLLPRTSRFFLVEVKSTNRSLLRPAQARVMDALTSLGIPVYVWTPQDGLTAFEDLAEVWHDGKKRIRAIHHSKAKRLRGRKPDFLLGDDVDDGESDSSDHAKSSGGGTGEVCS